MKQTDWQAIQEKMESDTIVLFTLAGDKPLRPGDYCEGVSISPSRVWDGRQGWQPCILVELGEPF